jgi:hypothetical protein
MHRHRHRHRHRHIKPKIQSHCKDVEGHHSLQIIFLYGHGAPLFFPVEHIASAVIIYGDWYGIHVHCVMRCNQVPIDGNSIVESHDISGAYALYARAVTMHLADQRHHLVK